VKVCQSTHKDLQEKKTKPIERVYYTYCKIGGHNFGRVSAPYKKGEVRKGSRGDSKMVARGRKQKATLL
jgi:hypothetical protein